MEPSRIKTKNIGPTKAPERALVVSEESNNRPLQHYFHESTSESAMTVRESESSSRFNLIDSLANAKSEISALKNITSILCDLGLDDHLTLKNSYGLSYKSKDFCAIVCSPPPSPRKDFFVYEHKQFLELIEPKFDFCMEEEEGVPLSEDDYKELIGPERIEFAIESFDEMINGLQGIIISSFSYEEIWDLMQQRVIVYTYERSEIQAPFNILLNEIQYNILSFLPPQTRINSDYWLSKYGTHLRKPRYLSAYKKFDSLFKEEEYFYLKKLELPELKPYHFDHVVEEFILQSNNNGRDLTDSIVAPTTESVVEREINSCLICTIL
jgi:hypothetical protein